MKKRLICTMLGLILLLSGCGSSAGAASRTGGGSATVDDVLAERMAEAEGGAAIGAPGPTSTPTPIPTVEADAPEPTIDLSVTEGVDVDLTLLSSTMVYSEVYNMMYLPEDYVGKVIKMHGTYGYWLDEESGNEYRSCIIRDATACCASGIEFVPKNPEACPAAGEDVTVVGVFDTYMEGDTMYCTLRDATIL